MDETRKQLHRTSDGPIAGVASGFAHYLGADPTVMRLIFLVLTVLTSGFFVLIYIALWLVLPREDGAEGPVDVSPDSVESARNCACGGSSKEGACKENPIAPIVTVGLIAGVLLVCVGMALIVSLVSPHFNAWQFWPLPIVAFGIVRLVLPARSGRHTAYTVVEGAVLCVVGMVMLLATLGVLSVDLGAWFTENWSLVAIAGGLLLLANSMRSPALLVASACVFALFCGVGLALYTSAGPANDAWMPVPYGQIAPDCADSGASSAFGAADLSGGGQAFAAGCEAGAEQAEKAV